MKKLFLLLLIFIYNQTIAQDLIYGVENKIIWGKENNSDISLPLYFKTNPSPSSLTVGYKTQAGTKLVAVYDKLDFGVDLSDVLTIESGLNEYGEIIEDYYIEIANYDFDNDGNCEIIIVVGNGSFDLWVNVLKYHPPQKIEDANRIENWSVILSCYGQQSIEVVENIIQVPIGSQGLFDEYVLKNGQFEKTE